MTLKQHMELRFIYLFVSGRVTANVIKYTPAAYSLIVSKGDFKTTLFYFQCQFKVHSLIVLIFKRCVQKKTYDSLSKPYL